MPFVTQTHTKCMQVLHAIAAWSTCLAFVCGFVGCNHPKAVSSPLWEELAPLPRGLAGFAHGRSETGVIVAGGTYWDGDVKVTSRDSFCYDAASATWKPVPALSRPFAFGVFGVSSGELLLLGGDDGERTHDTGLTADSRFALPTPLAYAGSAINQGQLYVLGGTSDLRTLAQTTGHFYRLNLATGKIESLPPYPDGPVIHAALVAVGDDLLAFTGGRWNPSTKTLTNTAAVWRYSVVQRTWTALADYPQATRGLAARELGPRYVLLAGGSTDSGVTADCFLYDVDENRYVALPSLPTPAMLIGLINDGKFIYALGGEDRARHRSAAVYRTSIVQLIEAAKAAR